MPSSEVVPRAGEVASQEPSSPPLSPQPVVTARAPSNRDTSGRGVSNRGASNRGASNRGASNRGASGAALLAGKRWRWAARWLGLLIFLIGASLLAFVFWSALENLRRFSNPATLQSEINKTMRNPAQPLTAYVSVLGGEALSFLYLILLGFLGSIIAGKGIQFFAASESVIDEAVVPDYNELP